MSDGEEALTVIGHLELAIEQEKKAHNYDTLPDDEKIRFRESYELKLLSEIATMMERSMPGVFHGAHNTFGDYLFNVFRTLYPQQSEILVPLTYLYWVRLGVCSFNIENLSLETATTAHKRLTKELPVSEEFRAIRDMTPEQFYEHLKSQKQAST